MGNLLKACDIFGTPQFTLYRGKDQFTTKTGGVASILAFSIILLIFVRISIVIFQSQKIVVNNNRTIYKAIPSNYNIASNPANKFMIAVGITGGRDFNKNITFQLKQRFRMRQDDIDTPTIKLEPCSFEHWYGINDDTNMNYYLMGIDKLVCTSLNQQFYFHGGFASPYHQYIEIIARQCQNNSIQDCPTPQNILSQNLNNTMPQVSIYMLNTIINPLNTKLSEYFIDNIANTYLDFKSRSILNIQLEEYVVESDYFFMPWTQIQTQSGLLVSRYNQQRVLIDTSANNTETKSKGNIYADIRFIKSNREIRIKRSFAKVTEAISFVGGLVTPIMLLMSIMRVYNRFSYEIEFGYRIFKPNKNSWFSAERFNFYYFLKYGVYSMLKGLRLYPKWEQIKEYQECRAEAVKQLDIYLLFKKIESFQEVCSTILEKHHQIGLHLVAKKTLKETRKKRKAYLMRDFIYNKLQKLQSFVTLEKEQIHKQTMQYFRPKTNQINFDEKPTTKEVLDLQNQFAESYKRLHQESKRGCTYSKKIIERIKKNNEDTVISMDIDFPIDQQKEEVPNSSEDYLSKSEEIIQQS